MFYHERLHCYSRLKEIIKKLLAHSLSWPKGNNCLADQLKRALSSSLLNLVEGNQRRSTKERKRFFEISKASLGEAAAVLDLVFILEFMDNQDHISYKNELLEMTKIISKL